MCEGCTGGVRGMCGRRLVAVIGILPYWRSWPGPQQRGDVAYEMTWGEAWHPIVTEPV